MILCYIAYILFNKKKTFKIISKTLLKNLLFFIIFKYYIISFSHMILSFTKIKTIYFKFIKNFKVIIEQIKICRKGSKISYSK